jgi:hypothetical protein
VEDQFVKASTILRMHFFVFQPLVTEMRANNDHNECIPWNKTVPIAINHLDM